MKKPESLSPSTAGSTPFPDEDWVKRFPLVSSFLGDCWYDDGSPRKQSTVTIREQDGLVLVSISDMDLKRGLYRTGKNVKEALGSLEKALEASTADWRAWKNFGKK